MFYIKLNATTSNQKYFYTEVCGIMLTWDVTAASTAPAA